MSFAGAQLLVFTSPTGETIMTDLDLDPDLELTGETIMMDLDPDLKMDHAMTDPELLSVDIYTDLDPDLDLDMSTRMGRDWHLFTAP